MILLNNKKLNIFMKKQFFAGYKSCQKEALLRRIVKIKIFKK
jgi:hypothetical protein